MEIRRKKTSYKNVYIISEIRSNGVRLYGYKRLCPEQVITFPKTSGLEKMIFIILKVMTLRFYVCTPAIPLSLGWYKSLFILKTVGYVLWN